jgi:lysophospholipase L1-like esterase
VGLGACFPYFQDGMADPDNHATSQPLAPRRSSLLRTSWGYLFPTLLFLLIVEGIFRAYPHQDSDKTISGFVVPDPELVWRLKIHSTGPVATNDLGLRDDPLRKDADVKILLLGDSVSWGDSILQRELIFASLMEEKLAHLTAGKTFEVINAGVPGYSTFQEKRYLELHGDEFDLDLVILQFCLNDVVERYQILAAYGGDNMTLGIDTREAVRGLHGLLLRNSQFYEQVIRWLQQRSRKGELYSVSRLAMDELSPELEDAWNQTLGELDGILRWTSEREIPTLLLITPYNFQLLSPRRSAQPQERLIAHVKNRNIVVLDLLPAFVAAKREQSLDLFVDANHFSVDGHRLAAELLAKKTREILFSDQH